MDDTPKVIVDPARCEHGEYMGECLTCMAATAEDEESDADEG